MKTHHAHKAMIIIMYTLLFPYIALAIDTITPITPLAINQTLVSNAQSFELGFFHDNSYVGIWYKHIEPKTYVWVANRDTPLTSVSGSLAIGEDGNVIILDEVENTVWSSNQSFVGVNRTVAQLLDSGNFVIRRENDENPSNYLWQSFENPTDTLLPGMKLGWNRKTGMNHFLQSWKTNDDPGSGDCSLKMSTDGFPEVLIWSNGTERYRSGAWNGKRLGGVPEMKSSSNTSIMEFEFLDTSDEISYSFEMLNSSVYSRLVISSSCFLKRFTWINTTQTWSMSSFAPRDQCDYYKQCGPYGICDTNYYPVCKCMKGFVPKIQQAWDLGDGSDGCVRSSKLDCRSDGFFKLKNMKLPDSSKVFIDQTMNLTTCGVICKRNCSCAAYANMDVTESGSGCVMWEVDLIDMRQYADSEGGGQELYIRVPASDLVEPTDDEDGRGFYEISWFWSGLGVTSLECVLSVHLISVTRSVQEEKEMKTLNDD
ncbi:receptor-like serine/threonine-protein kinase SD1-8 [Tanacetum coccineum]